MDRYEPEDPRPIVLKQSFNEPRFSLSEKEKERRLKALQKRFEDSKNPPTKYDWIPKVVIGMWIATVLLWTLIFLKFK